MRESPSSADPPSGDQDRRVFDRLNAALEGRYRVESEVGEGGMAMVYLAHDLKHNRKVALKVLKPELAAVVGAERFLAEIETTASLSHPHILPLFDSGEASPAGDGGGGRILYFVMPYVAGETLREKLDREKQLGVEEAVGIATKVGSALDYAHEHGVVHRDIKPGNILLSERGEPMVADFGIALAVAHAGGGRVTETGLSLGTPHYMSPEQATGDRDVDPRTDVYALGCVLYEMLTGDPPYQGSTAQAVLGQIIAGDIVPAVRKRTSIPPHVDGAVRKALEKVPADRFPNALAFTGALADRGFRYGEDAAASGAAGGVFRGRSGWIGGAGAVVGAVAGGVVAVALGMAGLLPGTGDSGGASSTEVIRFAVNLPDSATLESAGLGHDLAISPDGRMVVYQSGVLGGELRLNLRFLDRFGSATIRGTEEAAAPFFSPDGQWIVFQPSTRAQILRRVSVLGGPPVTITEAVANVRGASWSEDDWIYFGTDGGGLFRVAGAGGDPEPLTTPDPEQGESHHAYPYHIPETDAVVFVIESVDESIAAGGQLALLDLASGGIRPLGLVGMRPRYVSTGHLVYAVDDGSIRAVPFDRASLEITGSPVPMVESVQTKGSGAANFDVSRNGRLLYAGGDASAGAERPLLWVDRDGGEEEISAPLRTYLYPRMSPDGRRLALDVRGESNDIWVWDFSAETLTRLNLGEGAHSYPAWTSDGSRIAYAEEASGSIFWKASNNTGSSEILVETPGGTGASRTPSVYFFAPGGSGLVIRDQENPETDDDLLMLSLDPGANAPEIWRLNGPFRERNAELSPDGRWMAYQSDESGSFEIYVRPFPEVDANQIQISNSGGVKPLWSPDGTELFYLRGPPGELVSVSFETTGPGGAFTVVARERVVPWPYVNQNEGRNYDVSPDGRRFLAIGVEGSGSIETSELTVVLNWFEELRERMGAP